MPNNKIIFNVKESDGTFADNVRVLEDFTAQGHDGLGEWYDTIKSMLADGTCHITIKPDNTDFIIHLTTLH
jgi:hypothetical protein